ncbi:unnamed protein product [Natator depressus]
MADIQKDIQKPCHNSLSVQLYQAFILVKPPGYWQLPLTPDYCNKYEFLVLPFGLKNGPKIFQRMVNRILEATSGFTAACMDALPYLVICRENIIKQVLQRLGVAGLSIKASKCQLGRAAVSYLGLRVGSRKLSLEPAKVQVIQE